MKPSLEQLALLHSQQRLNRKKRNKALREHGYDPDGEDGHVYRELLFKAIAQSQGMSSRPERKDAQ
jgi:hypothetical protein